MNRHPMSTDKAAEAYVARIVSIRAKLAALSSQVDEHFGYGPDDITWGHVGDLGRIEEHLNELAAIARTA